MSKLNTSELVSSTLASLIKGMDGCRAELGKVEVFYDHAEEAGARFRKRLQGIIEKQKRGATISRQEYAEGFLGLYFFAARREQGIFPLLLELEAFDDESLEKLLLDGLTQDLAKILARTYDGNWERVEKGLFSKEGNAWFRGGLLGMVGALTCEGYVLPETCREVLKRAFSKEFEGDLPFRVSALHVAAQCHFGDCLADMQMVLDEGSGELEEDTRAVYVDRTFAFPGYLEDTTIDTRDFRMSWALARYSQVVQEVKEPKALHWVLPKLWEGMHEERSRQQEYYQAFLNTLPPAKPTQNPPGRSDPCPCGSGKKYKNCCMRWGKYKRKIPGFDPVLIARRMRYYPPISFNPLTQEAIALPERMPGQAFLEDYFSKEAIQLDSLVYLGIQSLERDFSKPSTAEQMTYLEEAFERLKRLYKREEYPNLEAFDKDFCIHYRSVDWLYLLAVKRMEDNVSCTDIQNLMTREKR